MTLLMPQSIEIVVAPIQDVTGRSCIDCSATLSPPYIRVVDNDLNIKRYCTRCSYEVIERLRAKCRFIDSQLKLMTEHLPVKKSKVKDTGRDIQDVITGVI